MGTSEELRRKIKEFEGKRLKAYKCPSGVHTIGYGHTRGVRAGQVITEAEAEDMLTEDIKTAERQVSSLGLALGQGELDALVDFTFNLGIGNLKKSTLLRYIKHHGTDLLIVREFMKWTKSGGKVLDGLVKRRKWEAERYVGKEIYRSEQDLRWYVRKG